MKVLVVGGNGFLGSAIVKQAVRRNWRVLSVSRSGKPFQTPAGHQPTWSTSQLVQWKAEDALRPSNSFKDLVRQCDACITTTGILLESNYKQNAASGSAGGSPLDILQGLVKGWRSNSPLDKLSVFLRQDQQQQQQQQQEDDGGQNYETMNRDVALNVANVFSATRSYDTGTAAATDSPFVYISAEDIFRPIVSARYIQTKREAEAGLAELAGTQGTFRPIFLRPGLMYHPQTRPLSTLPAAAFDLSSWLHDQYAKYNVPLPSPAELLRRFPAADLTALARLLTVQPLHVDTVAKAACEALINTSVRGACGTTTIQQLAGFRSTRSAHNASSGLGAAATQATSFVKPWPSQQMNGTAGNKRAFSTSTARSIRSTTSGQSGSNATDDTAPERLPFATVMAIVLAVYATHKLLLGSAKLHSEVQTTSQQEQMRARALTQGVYAWGSNRYNVVAPDTPLTTFVKTPRSIPYFDGMALRDIALEERHGVAVDANGDVLQWGLGFFDASLENLRIEGENLDDVPLARRREKEKANELMPRGTLGAHPLPPVRTLTGKNIVKIAASDEKIYALSRSGKVYVFSSVQARQWPGKTADWSYNPFTLFGTFDKRQIDHEKLDPTPAARFKSGEKIIDIQAGAHHLLALSSRGRTFTTPIDHDGNVFGQLGLRRVLLGMKNAYREVVMDPRMMTEAEQPTVFHQGQVLPAWALPPGLEDKSTARRPVTGPANRGVFVRKKSTLEEEETAAAAAAAVTVNDDDATLVQAKDGAALKTGGLLGVGGVSLTSSKDIRPHANIRFCLALHEVPGLRDVRVAQIASGSEHCVVRTTQGKVLGWGRQTHGQTGIGAQIALEAIPVPTEIVLSKAFPNSSVDIACTNVSAGADNTFFTMQRREPGNRSNDNIKIDLLAVGKGQWGTLGNAMWNQVTVAPARVKTVSGLMEFSEQTQRVHAVPMHHVSVGKPGSVAVVLDTVEQEGHQAFGRDVMVFGHNAAYQLGTGKRSNLAVPQHLHPLPPLTQADGQDAPPILLLNNNVERLREADINSGVLTHMPHKRLQLASATRADTHAAPSESDRQGRRTQGKRKRNVEVEESITTGAVGMAIYWKIL